MHYPLSSKEMLSCFGVSNTKVWRLPVISDKQTPLQNAMQLRRFAESTDYDIIFQGHPDDLDWGGMQYHRNYYVHDPTGAIRTIFYKYYN